MVGRRHPEAGLTIVAKGNGFRVYLSGKNVVVQDLRQGWWAELPTVRPDEESPLLVRGGSKAVARHPRLAEAAATLVQGKHGPVKVADLGRAVTSGQRSEPPFPMPTLEQVRRDAGRKPWLGPPSTADVNAVLAVAAMLACKGGIARETFLLGELEKRLRGREAAEATLKTAKERGRFSLSWPNGVCFWAMDPPPLELQLPTPTRRQAPPDGPSIFDDIEE